MLHREPEYRRRIREQAAKNEHYANREWDEATENTRVEKIVRTVERLVEQVNRYTDEKSPENTRKRRWKIAEVIGLWAAALVGAAGIWIGNAQRVVMQGQLNEMRDEQRAWISIFSKGVAVKPELTSTGDIIFKLKIELSNTGKNPASDVAIVFDGLVNLTSGILEKETELCNGTHSSGGISIFPGAKSNQDPYPVSISADRIKANGISGIVPSIAVCVLYRDVVTNERRMAPYLFYIVHKVGAQTRHLTLSEVSGGIDPGDLVLVENQDRNLPPS